MTVVLAAAVVILAVALVGVLGRWLAWKRDLGRRLNRVVLQLDPTPVPDHASITDLVTRMEAGAERVAIDAHLLQEERRRLELAMDVLGVGVVVADQDGNMVLRNPIADQFLAARHAAALVGAAVTDLLDAASQGRTSNRTVNLTGPPARVIETAAHNTNAPARAPTIPFLVFMPPSSHAPRKRCHPPVKAL